MEKEEKDRVFISLFMTGFFVTVLWVIHLYQYLANVNFSYLGLEPRTLTGLRGIFFSPLLHADLAHIAGNCGPLIFSMILLFYLYRQKAYKIFAIIYIVTGIAVWTFARPNIHIGASGLVYGLMSFLFFSAVLKGDMKMIAVSMLIIFLYAGMVIGLFPIDFRMSWESHLSGAFVGAMTALLFRKAGPPPPQKYFEEEDEEETLESPSSVGRRVGDEGWRGEDVPNIKYHYKEKEE